MGSEVGSGPGPLALGGLARGRGAAAEGGPEVADEDLRALIEEDGPPVARVDGLVAEAREGRRDEAHEFDGAVARRAHESDIKTLFISTFSTLIV